MRKLPSQLTSQRIRRRTSPMARKGPGETTDKVGRPGILIMENLNDRYVPYDGAKLPPSEQEWMEIFGEVAKFHAQFWESDEIRRVPLCVDETCEFKLSAPEDSLIRTMPGLVDKWIDAIRRYSIPHSPDLFRDGETWFNVLRTWKGENGPKLYRVAMDRLKRAPMTFLHGELEIAAR